MAIPTPCLRHRAPREERLNEPAAIRVGGRDRAGGDLVAGPDDAPQRRVEAPGFRWSASTRTRSRAACSPSGPRRPPGAPRERRARHVRARTGRPGARPATRARRAARPARCASRERRGRPRSRATRAGCGPAESASRMLLWILGGAGAGGVLLEPGRDQRPDAQPGRLRVHVSLDAPHLTPVAHRAIADDAIAVAHDAGVLGEVDLRPLLPQIGLRVRARPVQRRLERGDDLGDRSGVGGHGWCDDRALHAGHPMSTAPRSRPRTSRAIGLRFSFIVGVSSSPPGCQSSSQELELLDLLDARQLLVGRVDARLDRVAHRSSPASVQRARPRCPAAAPDAGATSGSSMISATL